MNWIQCTDLPKRGFAVVLILSISWSRQHSSADTLDIIDHKIETLYISGCRIDHKTDCWSQWTNLIVNFVDRIVARSDWFHCCITVLLCELLGASQLTVSL